MTTSKFFIWTLVIMLFLASNNIWGQTDSTRTSNKKNEIGLNIGPIILVTLGGTPYPQPIGLTYKRVFNKWAFRANFTFKPYNNSWLYNTNEQTQINDTNYIRTNTRRSRSYIGRIGIEYRHKFKKGWYLVGGIDFHAQYTNSNRQINEQVYKIDSVGNYGTAEQFNHTTLKYHKNLLEEKAITKQMGIGISAGLMIPAGKRWWVIAQFRADSFFGTTTRATTDNITGKTYGGSTTTFDFDTGPAISEVSLFYRF